MKIYKNKIYNAEGQVYTGPPNDIYWNQFSINMERQESAAEYRTWRLDDHRDILAVVRTILFASCAASFPY